MNATDWDIAKLRQRDFERHAGRHRAAEVQKDDPPLRHRVGEWMVKTGTRLLDEKMEMGVGVTGNHKHVTG